MVYTVTLNPALDKTVEIPSFTIGMVNRVTNMRTDPGGKGINVSKVISALGGQSRALGILGGQTGKIIADALEHLGIECDFIFTQGESRTNLKITDPLCKTNTDINEAGTPYDRQAVNRLLSRLKKCLSPGDIVVLSGRLPDGAPPCLYRDWISACVAKRATVFLDAEGDALRYGVTAGPALIKPNREELAALMEKPMNSMQNLTEAGASLLNQGVNCVAVSLGSEGAVFVSERETIFADSPDVPLRSTVGAGDAMVAALAYAKDMRLPFHDAVRLAMAAGAASVACSGTQAPGKNEILALLPRVTLRDIN